MAVSPEAKRALRWEWRTFGPSLAGLEARTGLPAQIKPRQSNEIYLLNSSTPHSAKIREGVLEVKQLLQVNLDGLELWNPAFKAAFPLSAPMVKAAFSALGLACPAIQRDVYALNEFFGEIIEAGTAFRAVEVSKMRRQFVFGGCAAEFVHLHTGTLTQDSFCIEHEIPGRIIAALRELGLDSHANINFPAGLSRMLAGAA